MFIDGLEEVQANPNAHASRALHLNQEHSLLGYLELHVCLYPRRGPLHNALRVMTEHLHDCY